MADYCAEIEFLTESPYCVICLTEIGEMKLQERSDWDWNEDCLFKLFQIEPRSLESFPSSTYFCQVCTLRNQNLWELYSQIHLLQQSLQDMKLSLESDFKSNFRFKRRILNRTDLLRYQLAKSIKILPEELSSPNQNYERENTPTSSQPSPEVSEVSFIINEVPPLPRDCSNDFTSTPAKSNRAILERIDTPSILHESLEGTSEELIKTERLSINPMAEEIEKKEKVHEKRKSCSEFPTPSDSHDVIETITPKIESSQATSEAPVNVDRLSTDPKVKKRARRKKSQKNVLENAASKFPVNQEVIKLKDLRIKISVIPPDLLNKPPINVHTIPGYIPTPIIRSSRRGTKSRLSIARILESESQSDVEIVSDNDVDFNVEDYLDAENTEVTIREVVIKSRKRSAREVKQVKGPKEEKQETQVLTENQETQVLETGNSSEPNESVNPTKRKRKRYPPGTKNRFYCDSPECTKTPGFNSKEQLEVHNKKVHEGITHPFKCEECGKAFRLLTQKTVHYKTAHLGEFNFTCEFCGKGFSGKGNLQKHRVIHTDERNFKCPDCPMNFKTAHGRVLHVRYAHTGERPYVCDICGKGFVSSTKLNNHLKCVHHREDRPIICHICGKNFPIQGYLYMHMRTHDNEAAAAAGMPVKRKPRWKKKTELTAAEEYGHNEAGGSEFKEPVEEGTVFVLEQSGNDSAVITLPDGLVEKIDIIDNSTVSTIVHSEDVQSKTLPLDLHLPVYPQQDQIIRVQTLKGNSVTAGRLMGSQFFIGNFDQNYP